MLCSRARQGLFHGVRALGIAPGGEILVPAYHHGAEVEAFERAGGDLDAPSSRVARLLLGRLLDPGIAESRRDNYRFLLSSLAAHVPRPFQELAEGAVPWVFPVATGEKQVVLERLAADRISAIDVWSVPHRSLAAGEFAAAAERRATTIALPVHQGLRRRDLEGVVASAARALRGSVTAPSPSVGV